MENPSVITHDRLGSLDTITVKNNVAVAQISLFGGHILSYAPLSDNRPRLWLSDNAILDGKTPIRGGIPICWPWFSNLHGQPEQTLPSHGYVRNQLWTLTDSYAVESGTRLELHPTTCSGDGFKGTASLKLVVTVGHRLQIDLVTQNICDEPFSYTCALHSYFTVEDIGNTRLIGLSGLYGDKTREWQLTQTPEPYTLFEETDRVHQNASPRVTIKTPSHQTQVDSSGHDSIVVWNPWQENATRLADMNNNGYQTMVCVESAITNGKKLLPGEVHTLSQNIG